tara:strand:- start:86 stop:1363 length:1278 start_codon:yes stop_codon:yes gene_type:complete
MVSVKGGVAMQDGNQANASGSGTPERASEHIDLGVRQQLADAFKGRADRLVVMAGLVNLLIVAIICAGAYAFYFADDLLVRDIANPVSEIARASNKAAGANQELAGILKNTETVLSVRQSLKDFEGKIGGAADPSFKAERDLEASLRLLTGLSAKLSENQKAQERVSEGISDAIKNIRISGDWRAVPDKPASWDADGNFPWRYLDSWKRKFRDKEIRAAYEFMAPLVELEDKRSDIWDEERGLKDDMASLAAKISAQDDLRLTEMKKLAAALEDEIRVRVVPELKRIGGQLENGIQQARDGQARLATMASTVDSALTKVTKLSEDFRTFSIYSSLGTRISILALLIFLVQILVSLYRYNMRLASYYRAREDALRAVKTDTVAAFGRLADVMTPQGVDFGKEPASPLQQVNDLGKAIAQNLPKTQR